MTSCGVNPILEHSPIVRRHLRAAADAGFMTSQIPPTRDEDRRFSSDLAVEWL